MLEAATEESHLLVRTGRVAAAPTTRRGTGRGETSVRDSHGWKREGDERRGIRGVLASR